METKFQTSFIPKKALIGEQKPHARAGVSIFMTLAVIIFVVSLAGAGFAYAWKGVLITAQDKSKQDLTDHEKLFDIDTIQRLKKKNVKIDFAKKILANHLSVSEIFNIIGGLTIDGAKFSSLDYSGPDSTAQVNYAKITMKGLANSYSSIAWQSDVFGNSQKYGTYKILKNPVLSNLSVDEAGNVGFDFTASIDPADISYEKVLTTQLQSEGLLPATPSASSGTGTTTPLGGLNR